MILANGNGGYGNGYGGYGYGGYGNGYGSGGVRGSDEVDCRERAVWKAEEGEEEVKRKTKTPQQILVEEATDRVIKAALAWEEAEPGPRVKNCGCRLCVRLGDAVRFYRERKGRR